MTTQTIHTEHAGTDPTPQYLGQVQRLVAAAHGGIQAWHVLPNHRSVWMSIPRGAAVVLDPAACVCADLFCTDMFHGTTIKEVAYTPTLDSWTPEKRAACFAKLEGLLVADSLIPPELMSDEANWGESLGRRNSFVGLYSASSVERDPGAGRQWYVVCQAGLDEQTATEFEAYLEECEADGMTNEQVWCQNSVVARARAVAKRNRRRLVARFATALGLETALRTDSDQPYAALAPGSSPSPSDPLVQPAAAYVAGLGLRSVPTWYVCPPSAPPDVVGFPVGAAIAAGLAAGDQRLLAVLRQYQLKGNTRPFTCNGIDVETEHSFVTRRAPTSRCAAAGQDGAGSLVFYNDAASTADASGGLIYHQGLGDGPLVLSGPTGARSGNNAFRGGPWCNDVLDAFPACAPLSTALKPGSRPSPGAVVRRWQAADQRVRWRGSFSPALCSADITSRQLRPVLVYNSYTEGLG